MSRLAKLGFIDTRRTQAPVRARVRSRGVPVALRDREVFSTADRREASELVEAFLGPCQISWTGASPDRFRATFHAVRIRDITMAHLDLHVPSAVDISSTGPWYCVHMPTSGSGVARVEGREVQISPYEALVTNPGQVVNLRFGLDSPHVVIRVEAGAVERTVARMRGRADTEAVRFDPVLDLTAELAARWHTAMQLLSSEIMTPGSLLHLGAGAGQLEDFLISTLLLIQPSTHHEALVHSRAPGGRRAVTRSLAYIEANLANPITLDDIAEHVGMSRRSIQQGFRDDLGTTPMAYVRDLRLERVRADLSDGLSSEGVTVTSVAEEWGFTHLGNFASMYRRRFGESPSQTLRR